MAIQFWTAFALPQYLNGLVRSTRVTAKCSLSSTKTPTPISAPPCLQAIMTEQDTNEMATMWWVYSAMCPTKHETLFKSISVDIDIEARTGKVVVADVLEINAKPIPNIVSGEPHRVRIDLPHGFEYNFAEIGSGSTKTKGGAIDLSNNNDSYAQFANLHLTGAGVVH